MRMLHRAILLVAALSLAAIPTLAQDGDLFNDGRLNDDAAAPIVIFCRYDGGLEVFSATGSEAFSASRVQIQGALAQAVLDQTQIQAAVGSNGSRLLVFPDGGVLVTTSGIYQFRIPQTACGGYAPDPTLTLLLVSDLVGIVEGEIVGGQVVVPDEAETGSGTVATTGGRTHVVQAGENLFRIGLRYGIPYPQLAAANGISNVDQIYAGQVLRIP
jgi:LysM repeat protein